MGGGRSVQAQIGKKERHALFSIQMRHPVNDITLTTEFLTEQTPQSPHLFG